MNVVVPINMTAFREVVEAGIRQGMDRLDTLIRTKAGRQQLANEQLALARQMRWNADDRRLLSRPWPKREDYLRWAEEHEKQARKYLKMTGRSNSRDKIDKIVIDPQPRK